MIANIYKIDPKKNAFQNKDRLQRIAAGVSIYLSAIWMMVIYVVANNNGAIVMKFVFVAMGLLFALLGNNMYNIQPNYFAGISLPLKLKDEDNWRKTHQLAGRLWFFGGLFFAVIALFFSKIIMHYVSVTLMVIIVLIPIIYSYNIYKTQKNSRA